ncbi:MAG: 16S rRNA (cytidine(1402)-2'-O)-methyltransferase [Pseudomonadota bacterium]|nr:16S rRNA (cytidine(1402)-2'-O)-methyltransferase [Pseudomonadota bacterium]
MLYLVSTPIGNLGDISERAKEVLKSVDLVACEDTRTSGQLFSLLGIKVAATIPYHEHNADKMRPKLLEKLKHGVTIALVSDAGTPLISDPGYKLVRDCYESGISVTTVPGANAVLSALQLSGLPSNAFYFAGFLSPKAGARKKALRELVSLKATLIIYETPNRLLDMLMDIENILGDRLMAVVREMTKKFEEVRRAPVSELITYYTQNGTPKGELVLVIGESVKEKTFDPNDIDTLIKKNLETHTVRDTAEIVADLVGVPKKQIYKRVVELNAQ